MATNGKGGALAMALTGAVVGFAAYYVGRNMAHNESTRLAHMRWLAEQNAAKAQAVLVPVVAPAAVV